MHHDFALSLYARTTFALINCFLLSMRCRITALPSGDEVTVLHMAGPIVQMAAIILYISIRFRKNICCIHAEAFVFC